MRESYLGYVIGREEDPDFVRVVVDGVGGLHEGLYRHDELHRAGIGQEGQPFIITIDNGKVSMSPCRDYPNLPICNTLNKYVRGRRRN